MSLVERIQSLSLERQHRIFTYYQSLPVPVATCDLLRVRKLMPTWIEKYTLFNGINNETTENRERLIYWSDTFISLIRSEIKRHANEPGFVNVQLSTTMEYLEMLKPEELFLIFKGCITKELDEYFTFMSDSIESLPPMLINGQGLMTNFCTRLNTLRESENTHAQYVQQLNWAEQTNDLFQVTKLELILVFSNDTMNENRRRYAEVQGQLNETMSTFLETTKNIITHFEATRYLFPPNDFKANGLKILNLDELCTRYDYFVAKILKLQENLCHFQQFLNSFTDDYTGQPIDFVIPYKSFIDNQLYDVQSIFYEMAKRSLIIETHPGYTIQKNHNFNVTVKYLAPTSLNLNISTLNLKPVIISDRMASNLITTGNLNAEERTGCGEITHDKLEVSSDRFFNQFQGMKIPFRPRDELVPLRGTKEGAKLKYKFHLLFYVDITFMGNPITLWTLSIPFVYRVNVSQLPLANLTIFWDVYLKEGNSAEGPEKVTVERLTQALNSYIQTETFSDNWNLTETQKKYLVEKLLKKQNPSKDEIVFRKEFEKAGETGLTFWKWFYGTVKLIKLHLNPFWKKGFIMGYLQRAEAEAMIENSLIGTFMVRFSDRSEGSISITWRHKQGPASVQPLTEKCLTIQNITDRVHNIPFFSLVICPYENSTVSKSVAFPPSPRPVNDPLPQFGQRSGIRPYLKHFALWSILVDC